MIKGAISDFGKSPSLIFIVAFLCVSVFVCVFCMITQKEIDLGTQNWNTL